MDGDAERYSVDRSGPQARPAVPHEPKRWLSTTVVVLLLAMALVFAFLIESLRADQYTLSFVKVGVPVSDTEVIQNHQRLVRDCSILTALGLAVIVLWLFWQYRAHANMRAVVPGTRFRPLWGLASWIVPGANLVLPPLAIRELWRASNLEAKEWRRTRTTPLLWLWWLLVLAALALAGFALIPGFGVKHTPEVLFVRDQRAVPAAGLAIVASVAAALLFGLLQGRLTMKDDRVRLGEWKGWSERSERSER